MSRVSKRREKDKKKKGALREWLDSIVFAVVVATIIRWLLIEAYMIPSPSMENSLLEGDYLFVSKMHYGARTPATPLQVPLTFQKIWGTNIPSYLDWIQLPMLRLPGFSEVKRFDPVVFNYPAEGTGAFLPDGYGDANNIPPDMRTYYIKRCIGMPGDELEVRDQQVYIDGKALENPEGMQTVYQVVSSQPINEERILQRNDIYRRDYANGIANQKMADGKFFSLFHTSQAVADKLKALDFVEKVERYIDDSPMTDAFFKTDRKDTLLNWSNDNYGPLTIPKEGWTVELTPENTAKYQTAIRFYEENDNVAFQNGKISIDGQPIDSYTFKKDYYFMMGDNRHNSADSRPWGFVPEDYVVGKALFVWWSVETDKSWSDFGDKVRWNRIFSLVD